MNFPTVSGATLSGREFTIPYGLEGEYNLVMIAFEPAQQFLLRTWLPFLAQMTEQYESFRYYELPTLGNLNEDQRMFIDQGMRRSINDPAIWDIVITLYLDKNTFRKVLDMRGESTIYLFLIDHEGVILWRSEGIATQLKKDDLTRTLQKIYDIDNTTLWEVD
jgi:hypothetical protein